MRSKRDHGDLGMNKTANPDSDNQTAGNAPAENTYDSGDNGHTAEDGPLRSETSAPWRYPRVDRVILDKLERMQEFFAPEYYDLNSLSPTASSRFRWPPIVTRIPERPSRPSGSTSLKSQGLDAICESAKHPRPCRFLLPLRVAEQESKARIHFTQIARLARELNRTLVLPNVGKSKVGACFKWRMSTYYDVTSLSDEADSQDWFVELESFRTWLNDYDRQGQIKSQLVSIASALPAHTKFREGTVHSNPDISVLAYDAFGAWERDLPGCFSSKFQRLKLETLPVFMSTTSFTNRDGSIRPIGDSIVEAFSAVSSRIARKDPASYEIPVGVGGLNHSLVSSSETQVMVLNWDLRHPVFPASLPGQSLQYSKQMHDLATRHTPKDPYLAVQWRMETVDPEVLNDCAHALVDVLSRILHDSALAANITTVWFAGDYPYPIVKRVASQRRPAVVAKSGTFRDFEIRHEEAIQILQNAFDKQGELSAWRLTDFVDSLDMVTGAETDLMQDSGVFGILDKLVSIKANLFVSGASRCSRRRSSMQGMKGGVEVGSPIRGMLLISSDK
ncbi:hypothetical protein BDZ97DRAFT_1913522 [Flammula alnicola]|nr:hypothetical protein BDZ97DRAFT_1913522 [Flammula alnicola]